MTIYPRALFLAALSSTLFAFTSQAKAAGGAWSATNLGPSIIWPSGIMVFDSVNNAGQVVTNLDTGTGPAVLIDPKGGASKVGADVPGLNLAYGMNSSGQVLVQLLSSNDSQNFVTGDNGQGLNWLGPSIKHAHGINDSGMIVGGLYTGTNRYSDVHAFILDPAKADLKDLGTLGGARSMAFRINASAQIIGMAESADGLYHPFITQADGLGMRKLPTLGGPASKYQNGAMQNVFDINDVGQVVGGSLTTSGVLHAFITGEDGAGIRDIGTLGGARSGAYAINQTGQVAGYAETQDSGVFHAFLTGANGEGMTDLNSLVTLPDGDYLADAIDLNDRGQILSISYKGDVYLLSAVPEPKSIFFMMAGLGLLSMRLAKKRRLRGAQCTDH